MKQVDTISLFTACKIAVAGGGGIIKLSDHETITTTSSSEFLQVQANFKKAGFRLYDYDEYKQTETWRKGNNYKTILLVEE